MNLLEALDFNLPLRRRNKAVTYKSYSPLGTVGITTIEAGKWIDPEFLFTVNLLTKEIAMASDWEVKTVRQAKKDRGIK